MSLSGLFYQAAKAAIVTTAARLPSSTLNIDGILREYGLAEIEGLKMYYEDLFGPGLENYLSRIVEKTIKKFDRIINKVLLDRGVPNTVKFTLYRGLTYVDNPYSPTFEFWPEYYHFVVLRTGDINPYEHRPYVVFSITVPAQLTLKMFRIQENGESIFPSSGEGSFSPYHEDLIEASGIGNIININEWHGNNVLVISLPIPPPRNMLQVRNHQYIDPDTKRPIRSVTMLEQVLQRYNLRNSKVLLPPFKGIDANDDFSEHANCLLNHLIKTYNRHQRKKNQISEAKIIEFFGQPEHPTEGQFSAHRMLEFAQKYKITARIYDPLGNLLTKVPGKDSKPALNVMLIDNHLYVVNSLIRRETEQMLMLEPAENEITNEDKIAYKVKSRSEVIDPKIVHASEIYETTIKKKYNISWTFKTERENGVRPCALQKIAINASKDYIEYDIAKAYPSVIKNATEDDIIPVFSIFDYIRPYNKESEIKSHFVYFVSKPALEHLFEMFGMIRNYLHGFQIIWLLENGYITIDQVTHVKPSMHTVKLIRLKKDLQKVIKSWNNWDTDRTIPDTLRLVIGKLASAQKKPFNCYLTNIQPDDAELLRCNQKFYKSVQFLPKNKRWPGSINIVSVTSGDGDFKSITASNINYYIVNKTSLVLMQAIHSARKQNAKVSFIRTDCMWTNKKIKLPKSIKSWFKSPTTRSGNDLDEHRPEMKWFDPDVIQTKSVLYIQEIFDASRCTLITGRPGSGKTHMAKGLHPGIGSAMTNLACLNMMKDFDKRCITIHKLLKVGQSHQEFNPKKFNKRTVWVDEASMVDAVAFSQLAFLLHRSTCQLILTGDFGQIPAKGQEPYNLRHPVFASMRIIQLTDNHRNDPELVYFSDQVYSGVKQAKIVRGTLPESDDPWQNDTHVVYTNSRRLAVNKKCLKARNKVFTKTNVSARTILQVRKSFKQYGLFKGDRVLLDDEVTEDTQTITVFRMYNNMEMIADVPRKILEHCEPGYGMTCHSLQGQTIEDNIVIHEIDKMADSYGLLYTAITRVRSIGQLSYCDTQLPYMAYKKELDHFDSWRLD